MRAVESLVRASRRCPLAFRAPGHASRQPDWVRRRFPSADCLLQEATSLVERRTSLFWTVHGQRRKSTSFRSLPGPVSGSPFWSTIGFEEWLLNIIVLRSSFLAGPFIDRAAVRTPRLRMNSLTPLSTGLEIQTRGSERPGRKVKDWRSWSHIVEPCLFWTVWSHYKIRQVHKKDGCVSLPSRRFCG